VSKLPVHLPQTSELRHRFTALQAERLQRILEISQTLTSTFDLDKLLHLILSAATELTDTEAGSILLLNESSTELRFAASNGNDSDKLANLRVPISGSLAGSILLAGKPLVIDNVQRDPRHFTGVDKQLNFQSRSLLGVPLMLRERPIGVLEALNKCDNAVFTEEDGQLLMTLAAQAAVAIENARLVTALQKAYAQLNQVDQIKSNFIAIASHELRTPLGLILGYAAILKDDVKSDAQAQAQLDVVLHSALKLRSLIDDMVNVQHIEEGQVQLDLIEFVLQDLIRAAAAALQELAEAKEHQVTLDLPAAAVTVKADRVKLALALNNLLSNAIKFTSPGGRILIAMHTSDGEAQVHLADTGIGIPADELERIFDRFYQVEPHLTRRHGGLGLGLAIAKGMIELHGGRIWCESVVGQGSRFSFAVPVGGPRPKAKETGPLKPPA
jgi:signal transduction histidine kinase